MPFDNTKSHKIYSLDIVIAVKTVVKTEAASARSGINHLIMFTLFLIH